MKKIMSFMLLCLLTITIFAVPVSATDKFDPTKEELPYEEVIVFSRHEETDDNLNSISSLAKKTDFEIARENILRLNLPEAGLSYIETACLVQIEEYENIPNCRLNEFSVLIPKNRSSSSPTYLTTYKNLEFYTSITSKSNITIEKNKFAFSNALENWFVGAVNLAFCFGGNVVYTVPWALITTYLPSELYTVHKSDWLDCYININPTQRTLFIKDGTQYEAVYYSEFGETRPYFVYHYNDATTSSGAATINGEKQLYPDIIKNGKCDESILDIGRDIHLYDAMPPRRTIANAVGFRWSK